MGSVNRMVLTLMNKLESIFQYICIIGFREKVLYSSYLEQSRLQGISNKIFNNMILQHLQSNVKLNQEAFALPQWLMLHLSI